MEPALLNKPVQTNKQTHAGKTYHLTTDTVRYKHIPTKLLYQSTRGPDQFTPVICLSENLKVCVCTCTIHKKKSILDYLPFLLSPSRNFAGST